MHFGTQFASGPHGKLRVILHRPSFKLHIRRAVRPSRRRQRLEFEWPSDQIPQTVFTFEWTVRPGHPFAREEGGEDTIAGRERSRGAFPEGKLTGASVAHRNIRH